MNIRPIRNSNAGIEMRAVWLNAWNLALLRGKLSSDARNFADTAQKSWLENWRLTCSN